MVDDFNPDSAHHFFKYQAWIIYIYIKSYATCDTAKSSNTGDVSLAANIWLIVTLL